MPNIPSPVPSLGQIEWDNATSVLGPNGYPKPDIKGSAN